jgi:hypothetical protein
MPDIDIKRHYCTDYDSIKHYPFNRSCEKHGAFLAKKIASVNLLEDNPIKCRIENDGSPYVIDGQGRLFAAKELKVPFYWEEIRSKKPATELITQYNANSTSFKTDDYINLYATSGNKDFIRLKTYRDISKLNREFLIRNYFNLSYSSLKQGLCKIPKLSDKQITYLSEVAELTEIYKSLCIARKISRGSDRDISAAINGFWKTRIHLSKNTVLVWLKDVANGDTNVPNSALLFQKLRMK